MPWKQIPVLPFHLLCCWCCPMRCCGIGTNSSLNSLFWRYCCWVWQAAWKSCAVCGFCCHLWRLFRFICCISCNIAHFKWEYCRHCCRNALGRSMAILVIFLFGRWFWRWFTWCCLLFCAATFGAMNANGNTAAVIGSWLRLCVIWHITIRWGALRANTMDSFSIPRRKFRQPYRSNKKIFSQPIAI